MVQPRDLIATARASANQPAARKPRQSDLKRALSTAYYAMFHAMCRNCADCLIGTASADRSKPAWVQAYRAIEHGFAKSQCLNRQVMSRFPRDIEDFANHFVDLQIERHRADYDPHARFTRSDVTTAIDTAEAAITAFFAEPIKDRRAFAAWVTLRNRTP